jgi:hypothetical protein
LLPSQTTLASKIGTTTSGSSTTGITADLKFVNFKSCIFWD